MLSINEKVERYNNLLSGDSDKELLEINMKESGHVLEEDFKADSEHELYKGYPYIMENKNYMK